MVDRPARDEYALLLRRLAAGRMSTDEFDNLAWAVLARTEASTDDTALKSVHEAAWCLYHDLWPYRLRGRQKLDRETRRRVARCVVFLKSDEARVGEALTPETSRGPLGFLDLIIGIAVVIGGILAIIQWGTWGAVAAATGIAVWLWTMHVRELTWQQRWHERLRADVIWPFAEPAAFERALRHRPFLRG